jgi:pentatricopeptide repeat protein
MRFDFAVYLGKKADKNKNPNQTRESKKRKTDEGAVVAYTTAVRACAAAGRPAEAEALVLEMMQVKLVKVVKSGGEHGVKVLIVVRDRGGGGSGVFLVLRF